MADKEELKTKFDGVTLEDKPEAYLRTIFAEAVDYQEQKLRDVNSENRLFYEGFDQQLEDRANDKEIVRSSLFINELKPAIDVRVAGVLTKIEETGTPIVVKPRGDDPTPEEMAQAKLIERRITKQMRDSGYLANIFEEHITGSEIFRSPSAVKVGWKREKIRSPRVITPTEQEQQIAASQGKEIPLPRVEYQDKEVGKPYVEWLDPDEFLYDPHCSDLERDCSYTIHQSYMFWHDIVSLAREMDWDMDKVQSYRDLVDEDNSDADGGSGQGDSADKSIRDGLRDGRGESTPDRAFRDGKILVAQFNIPTYNDNGDREMRTYVFLGDRTIISEETNELEEIGHPYIVARSNPLPGRLENFSSVDIGKRMARFLNEVYNTWVDGTVYGMFNILKTNAGTTWANGKPKIEPGAVWEMLPDKDAIEPLMPYQVHAPELTSLLTFIANRLREILNTPDLAQGFNATPNEKATSSKLRSAGTARRFVPINRRYGMALIGVAEMFLKLNRQFADDAPVYVLDVVIDAPGLTNITDPERTKETELLLASFMAENPVYQSPNGLKKLRNQVADLVRALKENHVNMDDYVPTVEEFNDQIKSDIEKQNIQIDMAAAQGGQPQQ